MTRLQPWIVLTACIACNKPPPEPAAEEPAPLPATPEPTAAPPPPVEPPPSPSPVEAPQPITPAAAEPSVPDQALAAVWKAYHRVRAFLAHDDFDGAKRVAGACATEVREAAQQFPEPMQETVLGVAAACEAVLNGTALDAQRRAFADATTSLRNTLARLPEATRAGYVAFKCAMVQEGHGTWLQKEGEAMGNPYMGDQMAQCGSKIAVIE